MTRIIMCDGCAAPTTYEATTLYIRNKGKSHRADLCAPCVEKRLSGLKTSPVDNQ